jgi:hypothetical protein
MQVAVFMACPTYATTTVVATDAKATRASMAATAVVATTMATAAALAVATTAQNARVSAIVGTSNLGADANELFFQGQGRVGARRVNQETIVPRPRMRAKT